VLQSTVLQCKIECHIAGVVLPSISEAPSRFQDLQSENAVWKGVNTIECVKTMDIRSMRHLRDFLPVRRRRDIELLVGSYYFIARAVDPADLAHYDELRSLKLDIDTNCRLWNTISVPEGFEMFAVDIAQDLVILMFNSG
jgi:hypothetical protein